MSNENNEDFFCSVCGLYQDCKQWGEDGKTPSFAICPCCGVEFGYEDFKLTSLKEYRSEWIRKGTPWFNPK